MKILALAVLILAGSIVYVGSQVTNAIGLQDRFQLVEVGGTGAFLVDTRTGSMYRPGSPPDIGGQMIWLPHTRPAPEPTP
jgi:hypothetical protein